MAPRQSEKEKANSAPKQRKRPGRIPVSCAECRRLKLRCDRKIPCETCMKRGCSAICPEGSLTSGKGSRFGLADTEGLYKKIESLRKRVTELEDALRSLQAAVTDEPHPLLSDDADQMNASADQSGNIPDGPLLSTEEEEALDAFGTLTLGLRGESRFFGQTARVEFLIHAPESAKRYDWVDIPFVSQKLVYAALCEMNWTCKDDDISREVLASLPSLSDACRLCEVFLDCGHHMLCPLPRTQLFNEILGVVYRGLRIEDLQGPTAHTLSLLFVVFAFGVQFDMNRPPYDLQGHAYLLLARICLRFLPPMYDTTLMALQSMTYMSYYQEYTDTDRSYVGSHKAWMTIGRAVKLAHGIGLHVNSDRWKLDKDSCERRSQVWWQIFVQDTWISFGFGRPPSISLEFVDCKFPTDPEERTDAEGNKYWGFHTFLLQFTKLLHSIITAAFGPSTPPYNKVLEFDRQIRDFPVPYQLRNTCGQSESETPTSAVRVQRWFAMACKEITLLSVHRPCFAQALNEQPADLLRHRYGPSVMATYRSAWRLIEGGIETFKHVPAEMARIGMVWSHCLAGGIVMCLLVTRAPSSTLCASALEELDHLCALFEDAQTKYKIINNLDLVLKLLRQGREAMDRFNHRTLPQDQNNTALIDRLSGGTHLLEASSLKQPDQNSKATTADPLSYNEPLPTDVIHPTIMHDLRLFESPMQDIFDSVQYDPGFLSQSQPIQEDLRPLMGFNFGNLSVPSQASTSFVSQDLPLPPGYALDTPALDETWQSFIEQLGF